MLPTILHFLRLSRPQFLLGGLLMYGLGALAARYHHYQIDAAAFLLGQATVTAAQLMTQYLNEFANIESDSVNRNRTPWTGGSGVISAGLLSPRTALWSACLALAASLAAMAALSTLRPVSWPVWALYLTALALAWSYSGPPLRLESSGLGELAAAVVVGVLTPALSYTIHTGAPDVAIVATAMPPAALLFAMLVVFEYPDQAADAVGGKLTLLVRLGLRRGAIAALTAMALAYVLLAAGLHWGVPSAVVAAGMASLPLAAVQGGAVLRAAAGLTTRYGWLAFGSLSLFVATAAGMAAAYWVTG